jgi:hypothetical protein
LSVSLQRKSKKINPIGRLKRVRNHGKSTN